MIECAFLIYPRYLSGGYVFVLLHWRLYSPKYPEQGIAYTRVIRLGDFTSAFMNPYIGQFRGKFRAPSRMATECGEPNVTYYAEPLLAFTDTVFVAVFYLH